MEHVLIVEDTFELLEVMRLTLAMEGYRVTVTQDGAQAAQLVRNERPDLILLDVVMPVTSGFEIATHLKQQEETRDIPIIFVTARADMDDLIHGLEVGVDYIAKPFAMPELLARVRAALRDKKLTTEQNQEGEVEGERQDSISMYFDFPEEIRVSCEQYLIYFSQFLKDLGIEAESKLEHKAGKVLFSVAPKGSKEALENIKTALEYFLGFPERADVSSFFGANSEIEVQRLGANIQHLKGQLALAAAIIQAKDSTIQAKDVTIRRLLTGQVFTAMHDAKEKPEDEEEVLGGALSIVPYESKGVKVNLPHIYRQLKQRFKRLNPPDDLKSLTAGDDSSFDKE